MADVKRIPGDERAEPTGHQVLIDRVLDRHLEGVARDRRRHVEIRNAPDTRLHEHRRKQENEETGARPFEDRVLDAPEKRHTIRSSRS
jgi:hypothetical protein